MTFYRGMVCLVLITVCVAASSSVSAQVAVPSLLQVPLFPEFDQFGNQFEVVQAYENGIGERSITAGIYDTGASVITFSALDQEFFFDFQGQPQIPIIPGAIATADAIGGSLTGEVSQPGRIYATGASGVSIDENLNITFDLTNAVSIGGIQAFVGTSVGSPDLPSIVGTPINVPSATNPNGLATVMDQTGQLVDLGVYDPAFAGISFELPDVRFVAPGTAIVPESTTYESMSFGVSLFGSNNMANPGNEISAAENPVQNSVSVAFTPQTVGSPTSTLSNQTFLFDTGAQLSIISPEIGKSLGLLNDLGEPIQPVFDTIDVQGAGGAVTELPGFILDTLSIPRTDGGLLEFTNVPVYVLDIGFGLDGILGMNLFNGADQFMYDPYNPAGPQVSVTFLTERTLALEQALSQEYQIFADPLHDTIDPLIALLEELLGELYPGLDLNFLSPDTGSRFATTNPVFPGIFVPEPSSCALVTVGFVGIIVARRRRMRN